MKTNKTYEEILQIAMRDQRHTALEEDACPVETLPADLLATLVDSKAMKDGPAGCGFEIVGFKMVRSDEVELFAGGRRVFPENDYYAVGLGWVPRRRLGVWYSKDRQFCGQPERYVGYNEVERRTKEFPCWVAILCGNGVVCEHWLRQRGFEKASNGGPAFCNVREGTKEEMSAYLIT